MEVQVKRNESKLKCPNCKGINKKKYFYPDATPEQKEEFECQDCFLMYYERESLSGKHEVINL